MQNQCQLQLLIHWSRNMSTPNDEPKGLENVSQYFLGIVFYYVIIDEWFNG